MKNYTTFLSSLAERIKLEKDTQLGGNEGGIGNVIDKKTQKPVKIYFKSNSEEDQNSVEIVSERLYQLAGLQVVSHFKTEVQGKSGLISQWNSNLKPSSRFYDSFLNSLTESQIYQLCLVYLVSAWVENWDSLAPKNLMMNAKGDFVIIDTGGSFHFRATKGRKTENDGSPIVGFSEKKVNSLKSILARVPGSLLVPLFNKNETLMQKAKRTLSAITEQQIKNAFRGVSFSSISLKQALIQTLIKRKALISN